MVNILHISSGGRGKDSLNYQLSAQIVTKLKTTDSTVTYRDLRENSPFVDERMISSYFTPADVRTDAQKEAIIASDEVVKQLMDHDIYVFGVPMYNFFVPANFKAWGDLAARSGVTFRYTNMGSEGLLKGKKAYIVITSGGTVMDSEMDFLTPWLRKFFGFLGVTDVRIFDAMGVGREKAIIARVEAEINNL